MEVFRGRFAVRNGMTSGSLGLLVFTSRRWRATKKLLRRVLSAVVDGSEVLVERVLRVLSCLLVYRIEDFWLVLPIRPFSRIFAL